jgi:hypothetical protein
MNRKIFENAKLRSKDCYDFSIDFLHKIINNRIQISMNMSKIACKKLITTMVPVSTELVFRFDIHQCNGMRITRHSGGSAPAAIGISPGSEFFHYD